MWKSRDRLVNGLQAAGLISLDDVEVYMELLKSALKAVFVGVINYKSNRYNIKGVFVA